MSFSRHKSIMRVSFNIKHHIIKMYPSEIEICTSKLPSKTCLLLLTINCQLYVLLVLAENKPGHPLFKHFLYSYLKEQPIWQSLRFWNAAFFDAVQSERARKPLPTRYTS